MSKAVYFSRFLPSINMGGGSRRMMQIYEGLKIIIPGLHLITSARGDMISAEMNDRINKRNKRNEHLFFMRLSGGLQKWGEEHRKMVYRLRKISEVWMESLRELPALHAAVIDDPIYFLPVFKKLRKFRIPVIAVCHNLETIVADQTENKWAFSLFRDELEILSQCRLVVTISREEDVLLKNLGIRTVYFPYYPVTPICDRLLAIREKRRTTAKESILMAGTTNNLPTRYGMRQAAAYWHQNHLEKTYGKLMMAGYRSEVHLESAPYGDSVDLRGTLTNEQMDDLLSRIKALLAYQESGAGALTRICEMLIAGVPVLANAHAARSYYNLNGVIEFRELDALGEALHRVDMMEGEVTLPSAPDLSYLFRKIQEILI